MTSELNAHSEPGLKLVRLAEALAGDLSEAAAANDAERRFPREGLELLKESGYLAAPVPVELGGSGVFDVHDLVVASSRLARADAALAIGVNMHLAYVVNLVRRWRAAQAEGNERRLAAFASSLDEITRDGIVLAAAISEPGQDLTRPSTIAARTDDGWVVSGRKIFCTMSPAADRLYAAVTYADEDGRETFGYALVPTAAPGVVVHDDWDALGMRASGSNSVSFESVRLPAAALRGGFPVGSTVDYIERNLDAGLFHAAAALGIAEEADLYVTRRISLSGRDPGARTRTLAAENVVELAACRAIVSRSASLVDSAFSPEAGWTENLLSLFGDVQAAKTFVGEAAVRVVDRALAMSGGAGYLNGSPLARAYRDVRATAFMHPLGSNRAYDYLAELALQRLPSLH